MSHTPSAISISVFFFFNDTATTEIYTLSLHDALPIFRISGRAAHGFREARRLRSGLQARARDAGDFSAHSVGSPGQRRRAADRKSTRLNSSHSQISYAVFCLKNKYR